MRSLSADPATVGAVTRSERSRAADILASTGAFLPLDIDCALQLFDAAFEPDDPEDAYLLLGVRSEDGILAGFGIWGKAPLTDAIYELYWIAVHAREARRGHGRTLLDAIVGAAAREGARGFHIETSSTRGYAPARRLYESAGFRLAARFPDYYRVGDDRLVFTKAVRREEAASA